MFDNPFHINSNDHYLSGCCMATQFVKQPVKSCYAPTFVLAFPIPYFWLWHDYSCNIAVGPFTCVWYAICFRLRPMLNGWNHCVKKSTVCFSSSKWYFMRKMNEKDWRQKNRKCEFKLQHVTTCVCTYIHVHIHSRLGTSVVLPFAW